MKKIIFLSLACLTLTGCTVNYNLEIKENSFKETINGNILKEETTNKKNETDVNVFSSLINEEQSALLNTNILYKKNIKENKNSYDFNYEFTYNEYDINESALLNKCFKNFKFEEKDNKYYFTAFGQFYCKYSDEITINITTDHNVSSNNAKEVKDNTYTWVINDENSDNVDMYLVVDKNITTKKSNFAWSPLKTIVLILILITSGIAIFFMKKKEQQ